MEAKYSVGDMVRIRDADIMEQLNDDGNVLAGWNSLMEEWCGCVFVISDVFNDMYGYPKYKFQNMSDEMDEWTWTEDMFDLVEEDPKLEEEFLNVIGI